MGKASRRRGKFVLCLTSIANEQILKDHPELVEHVGKYVERWEPKDAIRPLRTTDDPRKAKRFDTEALGHDCWARSEPKMSKEHGRPVRPLTAFNCEVIELDKARARASAVDEIKAQLPPEVAAQLAAVTTQPMPGLTAKKLILPHERRD